VFDFPYAYSKYKEVRAEELDRLGQAKKQQEKEIKQTELLINKFRAKSSKASFAQSLIKKLEKTERIEVESDSVAKMKLTFPLSVHPGKWVLELEGLGKSYGEKKLFKEIGITVGRGEKIALLGPNGVGKSTLLKAIMKEIDYTGIVAYGHNVNVTYFAQDQAEKLDVSKTVFDTVDDIAKGEMRKDLRSILGTFLFSGEDVDKKVSVLSGGERTRLALCQLLLSPSNFLILDEPTNHLDIQSKDVLKKALQSYQGTFVVVSHDREFLDGLTNRIWDIENQGLKIHHFSLKEYLDYKMNKSSSTIKVEKKEIKVITKEKEVVIQNKTEAHKKIEKELKRIEEKISTVEQEIEEQTISIGLLDFSKGETHSNILTSFELKKTELSILMSEWEEKMGEL
jgi:ATP-binding cassette subfamily F protein 3